MFECVQVIFLLSTLFTADACTSIVAGRSATLEGSAIATHNDDCWTCDPRLAFVPARDHAPHSHRAIAPFKQEYPRYVGVDRSDTYTPADGQADTVPIGFIDQVPHTYAYWEASYPLVNEHGLGFGESTCPAKLFGRSVVDGGHAHFTISELMRVAMERCKTARCAIHTMGRYAVSHGLYGEDPAESGAGESVSIVDNEESWVFHVLGGLNYKSATWVAQRVPNGDVAVIANAFIIHRVNCKDGGNFMCSENLFSNAREAKLCDFRTEADFDFRACYGANTVLWYTSARVWRVFSLASPDQFLPALEDDSLYPFSMTPSQKVSRTDVMNWTRDVYHGTEFDMQQGVLAGPFGNPNRLEGGEGMEKFPGLSNRGLSIPRTVSSAVVEAKPLSAANRSIAWFAVDQPLTSVWVPLFAIADQSAAVYRTGRQEKFSRESAWWAFNFVSNWMNINFADMMSRHVGPARDAEQQHIMNTVQAIEASWPSQGELNVVQRKLQEGLIERWWALADEIVWRYNDGYYTHDNSTKSHLGYPDWWLQMIGFDNSFIHPRWVKPGSSPPAVLWTTASNFVARDGNGQFWSSLQIPGVLFGLFVGSAGTAAVLRGQQKKTGLNALLCQ